MSRGAELQHTNMKHSQLTRRQFTRTMLITAGAISVAPAFLRGQNLNQKLNLAVIATGGRGGSNLESVSSENIVALCDVNGKNLAAAAAKYPSARKHTDFRKVFEHAGEFDAVVVSTCEHTHAFATMLALQQWMNAIEAAAKAKVATQMGIQIHATENYRQVVELVQSGIIGPVQEAHVWVSRAWGWQSEADAKRHQDIVWVVERPAESQPVPEGLDWDLWLGPAPARPFHSIYFPGPKWYRWWDFGNGTMSDLGSHWNDLPFWALKLQAPLTVEANGPPPHPEIAPASMSATYEYGARGDLPPVKLTWHQGESKPGLWTSGGIPKWDSGCLFIGSKGMLLADYSKHMLLPEKQFEWFQRPAPTIPRSPGHHQEWLQACKTGQPTSANFEYSGWLTEANHLGNVAYRVGKKLQWDPKLLKATNAPEAAPFIHRTYRKGWEL